MRFVDDEWYTPREVVEACRAALGAIDLDPASCELAQAVVQAGRYFTAADDGLVQPWAGRVFLNPPYSRNLKAAFVAKLAEGYRAGAVVAACLLVNIDTSPRWFDPVRPLYGARAALRGRPQFWKATPGDKTSPAFGGAVVYLGRDRERFAAAFRDVADVDFPAVSVTEVVTAIAA